MSEFKVGKSVIIKPTPPEIAIIEELITVGDEDWAVIRWPNGFSDNVLLSKIELVENPSEGQR